MTAGSPPPIAALVMPIVQLKYLGRCIRSLKRAGFDDRFRLCIVNDGNAAIKAELNRQYGSRAGIDVVHLDSTRNFAGANNAGWRYLLKRYPDLQFLGSLNDDTKLRKGALTAMLNSISGRPDVALVGPIMECREGAHWFSRRLRTYATWALGEHGAHMIPLAATVPEDAETELIGGFCFLARRNILEAVNFLHEEYRNSCEDVDLCLKMHRAGFKIVVSSRARVFHVGGASRYLPGANTDMDGAHKLLRERWNL